MRHAAGALTAAAVAAAAAVPMSGIATRRCAAAAVPTQCAAPLRIDTDRLIPSVVAISDTIGTTDRPTDEPAGRPTDRPTDRSADRPTDRPTGRPTVRPTDRPTDRSTGRLLKCPPRADVADRLLTFICLPLRLSVCLDEPCGCLTAPLVDFC